MPTCPKGHQSTADDYCDECGTPIGGTAAAAPAGPVAPAATASPRASGEPCPQCSAPRTGRFCEVCGHDFVAAELSPAGATPAASTPTGSTPTPASGAAAGAAPAGGAVSGDVAAGGAAAGGAAAGGAATGAGMTTGGATAAGGAASGPNGSDPNGSGANGSDPNGSGAAAPVPAGGPPVETSAPGAGPPAGGTAQGWRVVVTADRAYHARMRAIADPGVEPITFPAFCPERRFALQGVQVLIGRQSRSRGIEPDIDLTGPPTDPAVSHAHAVLVAQPDGGWALVDLGSANGTYLNEGVDAIEENVPLPLADGDRIHLGAFSTLTLHRT